MTGLVSLYCLFASTEEANRIAAAAVTRRNAACVNILGPVRSIFQWEGELETRDEVAAIFKTTADGAPALIRFIEAEHSYDVPAITAWPVDQASRPYRDWVRESIARP